MERLSRLVRKTAKIAQEEPPVTSRVSLSMRITIAHPGTTAKKVLTRGSLVHQEHSDQERALFMPMARMEMV